jgi:MFS family permease
MASLKTAAMFRALARTPANNIWKLYAVRLIFWTHFIASVLVPFFRDWGGISFAQIFFLNAWFMLCNFFLEVPTGTVADFWGRRASLFLGCAVGAVGVLVYSSIPRFSVFLVGEVLLACSFTLMSGADEALLYDSLAAIGATEQSKTVFARLASFQMAGIVIGALAGSAIVALTGSVRAPFMLQAVPMACAALLTLTLHEPARATPSGTALRYRDILRDGVGYFARHRVLRLLTADMVLVGCITWLIIWLYQPLLERAGIGVPWFGSVHAVMCIGQIGVLNNVARLESALGSKRRLLLVGALLPGMAFLVLGVTTFAPVVVLCIWIAASFGLSRTALFSSYMNKHIPSAHRATVLSCISMQRTLAIAIVNPIAGKLADWSIPSTMLILGVSALALAAWSQIDEAHLID